MRNSGALSETFPLRESGSDDGGRDRIEHDSLYILRPLRTFVKVPDWQVVISERTFENSHVLVRYRFPEKLLKVQKELLEDIRLVRRTCFILDENLFRSFVKEIKYFSELGLVSTTDVQDMKKELYQLLRELEILSEKGSYHNGNSLSVYLSNVNFEATYSYVEKARFQICFLRVYSINSMDSRDSKICDYQKKWIHSLKRHSTLISQSGEIQRMMFFNEQKKVVDAL